MSLIVVAVTTCILVYHQEPGAGPPWRPDWAQKRHFDALMGLVAAFVLVGVIGWGIVRRFPFAHGRTTTRVVQILLALAVLVSGFDYLYARRSPRRAWAHTYDSYHYLLGPKYYEELGYFGLYACTIEALDAKQIPDDTKVRDLSTYATTTAGELRAKSDCRSRFTPRRWAAFEQDVRTWADADVAGPRLMRRFIRDQGYNGTPFHALTAGAVANAGGKVTRAALHRYALIDIFGLGLMLLAVTRVFGWRVGLVFAAFFFTSVVDRFGYTGGSFVRLWWLVALGLGLAALRARRWAWAGVALTLSAMLNVFPLLFLIGASVSLAARSLRVRRLLPSARRFILACAITTVVAGSASVVRAGGVDDYQAFFEDMRVHAEGPPMDPEDPEGERLEKHPGYGIGLKFVFLYRGEHHAKSKGIGRARRTREFREIAWVYRLLGWSLCLAALGVAARLDPVEAAVLVGVTWFFMLLGTVAYYFACVAFLVLMLHRRVRDPGGLLLLASLFALSVFGHGYLWAHPTASAVLNNTVLSSMLLIYLSACITYLGLQTGTWADLVSRLAAPAASRGHQFARPQGAGATGRNTRSR